MFGLVVCKAVRQYLQTFSLAASFVTYMVVFWHMVNRVAEFLLQCTWGIEVIFLQFATCLIGGLRSLPFWFDQAFLWLSFNGHYLIDINVVIWEGAFLSLRNETVSKVTAFLGASQDGLRGYLNHGSWAIAWVVETWPLSCGPIWVVLGKLECLFVLTLHLPIISVFDSLYFFLVFCHSFLHLQNFFLLVLYNVF